MQRADEPAKDPYSVADDTENNSWWDHLLSGVFFLMTAVFAIATAVSILTCGVATPLMIGLAIGTGLAGTATGINGAAEIGEAIGGYNFVRDGWFGGNETAYGWYSFGTDMAATVGSIIGGGWLKYNQPRIQAYKNIESYQFSQYFI